MKLKNLLKEAKLFESDPNQSSKIKNVRNFDPSSDPMNNLVLNLKTMGQSAARVFMTALIDNKISFMSSPSYVVFNPENDHSDRDYSNDDEGFSYNLAFMDDLLADIESPQIVQSILDSTEDYETNDELATEWGYESSDELPK